MPAAQAPHDRDSTTIAAIATPPGAGGIGIIRISGPAALSILEGIFHPSTRKPLASHRLTHGWIIDPADRSPLDEVMAVLMTAPRSYTREDVVEIQCHSSSLVLRKILSLILDSGAVLAEPGEFTKRAFLNGRIDLTRAEAVIELLQVRTDKGLAIALDQLQGGLYDRVAAIREDLVAIRAILEVAIDFPDEDAEIIDTAGMLARLAKGVITPLEELVRAADQGKIFREGISVVILGRPNVGKSSLLNCLLREERAIVTEIPGTTRDIIEEQLNIKGIPVRIVDTAGIRETAETVEEIGIRKARQKQEGADLVLLVIDGSALPTAEDRELAASIAGQPAILVVNKIDLISGPDSSEKLETGGDLPMVRISARTGEGLADLEEAIFSEVSGGTGEPEHDCIPNVRHLHALTAGLQAARQLATALENDLPPDLVAIEVQSGLDHLGEIIGLTSTEDILDAIFTKFCLGK